MPVVHRQRLAARLRQNWYAMYPTESTDQQPTTGVFQMVDDSLTSLAWLQNLNVMKLASSSSSSSSAAAARSVSMPATTTPTLSASLGENQRGGGSGDPTPAAFRRGLSVDDDALTRLRVDPNEVLDMTNRRQERSSSSVAASSPWNAAPSVTGSSRSGGGGGVTGGGVFDEAASAAGQLERDRYRYDGSMKPPYSYATLICMAMQEAPDRRITLAHIYNWISDNFAFYRQADQNWQHSIRHNLSLNKCFQKVPRGKDEPGKGGFWTLNPEFNSLVDKGIFKKRRLTFACDSSSSSPSSSGLGPKKDSNAPQSPRSHRRSAMQGPPPLSRQGYSSTTPSSKENIRISDPILDFRTDSLADVLDLHWALSQNIDVGGLSVKTEDIIDMHLPPSSSSAAAMFATAAAEATGDHLLLLDSPPSSDSDSELELNSLLNFSALHPTAAVRDAAADDVSLDLTVHGIGLPPPDWWNGSINGRFMDSDAIIDLPSLSSRFDDNSFHPWAENRNDGIDDVLMAFDAGSCLIDSENLDIVADGFKLL